MLVNHNIYTYHRYSIDACDLVFSETKKNHARVPPQILEMAELIERYFTAENAGEIEERLAVLMEPFMRKGNDKSHTDNDDVADETSSLAAAVRELLESS